MGKKMTAKKMKVLSCLVVILVLMSVVMAVSAEPASTASVYITSFTADDDLNTKITNVDASKFQAYFAHKGRTSMNPLANPLVKAGNTHNINSIFLMALAAWESGWGTSNYANTRYNYFGYGAVYSNPDKAWEFNSADECVDVVSRFIKCDYLLNSGTYSVLMPTGQVYNPGTAQYHNGTPYIEQIRNAGSHYHGATVRGWIVDWNLNSQSEMNGILSIMNDFVSWHVQTYGVKVGISTKNPPEDLYFELPVDPSDVYRHPNCGYNSINCAKSGWYHTGVDYSPYSGKPFIHASAYGKVVTIQQNGQNDHGMGNTVIIEHILENGGTVYSLYAHLDSIQDSLSMGNYVNKGTIIGIMGGSGYGNPNYWGVHLHFEIKDGNVLHNPVGGGLYWGYTPSSAENYGYHNPYNYFDIVRVKSPTSWGSPPIASFTYSPEKPVVDEEVTFNASASRDPNGGVISYYRWEFYKLREYVPFPLVHIDEGTDKEIIKYSFYSEGTYQIRLTVTDDEGEVNSTEKYIEVKKTLYEPLDIVLVTDISGSMDWEWKGERKLDSVKKAAKTFLNLMDKTNDRVGLVSFAGSATFDLYLTNDFHRAKNTIDGYSAGGYTNIGDALTKAVNELKTLGRPEAAKAIIFLTDGNITTGMREYEVLTGPVNDAADNDITIYSLGYGGPSNLKEDFLTDVAENTGGKYYYVPSPEELENIYLELSGRVVGLTPLGIEKNKIHQDEIITLPFFIDATIDMFRAMLNWGGSDLDIGLKNPSGEYIVPDAKVRYSGPNTKPEWYEIIHPEPGAWTAKIYGKDVPEDYENFTMHVMASTPITLSVRTDRATYDGGESVLITAELMDDHKPITGTHVFAEITMPDGSSETLKLYDDGTHKDIYPDDGIYTNSFRKTYWVGIYDVKASAMDGFTRVDTTSFRILTPPPVTAPQELWNRTFGGHGRDYAEAVIQTTDGGYAMGGWTTSYGAGSTDAWLVKTDGYGNEEWNKTFGGYKGDGASSIVQTSDGGYALAGYTVSYGTDSSEDFWLVKTDSSGNVMWSKVFGSRSEDEAMSVIQASDGGYVIAGVTAGNGDAWLVKTDGYGNEQWNKVFGGRSFDMALAAIQTFDGGFAFAGGTQSYGAADAWLVKIDCYGNEEWNRTFGGYDYDTAYSVIQTWDGGYAFAGGAGSYGTDSTDFWLVKTDCFGNEEWNKTFGGYGGYAGSVIQTSDGGYAIAGWTGSYGAGTKAWVVKTDCYGNEQWNKTVGGYDQDGVKSIIQTSDGGYAIAGWTGSYGAGNLDAWLIKLAPPGTCTLDKPPIARITMKSGSKVAYENQVLELTVPSGGTAKVDFSASRSSDPEGSISSYKWCIGGSFISSSRDFSYYLGEGIHDIFLTVTDNKGAEGSVGATVEIIGSPGCP